MAIVLEGGADHFGALAFGRTSQATLQMLDSYNQRVSQNFQVAERQFSDKMRDVFARVDESEAMRLARAVGRKIRNFWSTEDIHPLTNIGMAQHASVTMQRWVMAEPTVRKMYHEQKVEGYVDSYVDVHGQVYGSNHYDYRRATQGLIVETPEEGWQAATYMEDLLEGDRELLLDEKADIQATWEFIRGALKRKKDDPTSPTNAAL